jgi:uncharacterized protein YndB with AHSA1/START domain
MKLTVSCLVDAPVAKVWEAYVTPEDIVQWNAASDDWHTTRATVDLKEGGVFLSRMEAKDGSFGFDFTGTYTRIIPHQLIEYSLGERDASVQFASTGSGTTVSVTFDAEGEHSLEQQQAGWQAILQNFANHVASKG